jgi:hypothetical protein
MGDQGVWIYGVLDAGARSAPSLTGVDGEHRVELVREGRLAAIVSTVPLDEFGADALKRGLEDLQFLEALARAHERVLDAALALGTVVPFRLCTIYESPGHVREMLAREENDLAAALSRLSGMEEWGVKGYLAARPEPAAARAAPASGADYLRRKLQARDDAEIAHDESDAKVAAIHEQLAAHAAGAVLNRPQDRQLSGRDAEMVLNASYLVAADRVDAFTALVESLTGDGVELECTGPWPAYHFVEAG